MFPSPNVWAARAVNKKHLLMASPSEPLVHIQNKAPCILWSGILDRGFGAEYWSGVDQILERQKWNGVQL